MSGTPASGRCARRYGRATTWTERTFFPASVTPWPASSAREAPQSSAETNPMNKARLFDSLSTQDPSTLLDLLQVVYDVMTYDQREAIFGRYAGVLRPAPVEG